ncbi:MAG: hypothetical protein JKY94_13435 [Rhodobacteraceae bacterium]|nr:hypothetical protein [Paracoccaceae bacterium]
MTAFSEYVRLEASGLWRATLKDQRREVIVSIGEATLAISTVQGTALTHWSLAAVNRINPGQSPAIYCPDGDPDETLELDENQVEVIDAIERLRSAIDRARPHPGRLRHYSVLASVAAVVGLMVFWMPGALLNHTVSVVPDIKRQSIGAALLGRIERVSGRACSTSDTRSVLAALARRTGARQLVVLPSGVQDTRHLPGGIILLNKALIEDYEDPAIVAGYILTERARATDKDPLAELLANGGPSASFRLLTTGELTQGMLDQYAEYVLVANRPEPVDDLALALFAQAKVPSTPYAYARDITGETVLPFIEADPMAGLSPEPVLADRDWVLLQNICGG